MTPKLTSQQISFFAKNGYLELSELLTPEECDSIREAGKSASSAPPAEQFVRGRDLWRLFPPLKLFALSRKMSAITAELSPKHQVRVGCDQWFPEGYSLDEPTKLKRLFSLQGISIACFFRIDPPPQSIPERTSPVGLYPFPSTEKGVMIVHPDVLLNWPRGEAVYSLIYCDANAVYVQNPLDRACNSLKNFGYGFGDLLRSETHPMVPRG